MKIRWKKVIALMLAGVMTVSMTGCGNNKDIKTTGSEGGSQAQDVEEAADDSNAMGRYIEKISTINYTPTGIGEISKLSDGSLAFIDIQSAQKVTSVDGGVNWNGEDIPDTHSLIENPYIEFTSTAIAPDGGIFYSYNDWSEVDKDAAADEQGSSDGASIDDAGTDGSSEESLEIVTDDGAAEDSKEDSAESSTESSTDESTTDDSNVNNIQFPVHYFYIDKDGNRSELNIKLDNEKENFIKSVYSEDGRLFGICYSGTIYEIDVANQTAKQLFKMDDMVYLELWSSGSYIIAFDGSKIYLYNLDNGKLEAPDPVLDEYIQGETKDYTNVEMTMDADNKTLYIASPSGLYAHALNGSVMERLIDGALCNLGDPVNPVSTLYMTGENSFVMGYSNGEIDSYVYDPDISTVPDKKLCVYSLCDSTTIRQAITMYRKNNPDIYVKLDIGITDKDGMTEDDAIKNLNTQLLAGEGPDLIVLDRMPMDSYIEKGMLMDLSDTVAEAENSATYFDNILKTYQKDDGLYAVPIRVYIPLLAGDKDKIDSITDLNTLADAVEKVGAQETKSVMGTYGADELLERLYLTSSPSLVKDGNIDQEALTNFLTQAKRIYDVDEDRESEKMKQDHTIWIQEGTVGHPDTNDKILSICHPVIETYFGEQFISAGYTNDINGLEDICSVQAMNSDYTYKKMPGQSDNVFLPGLVTGISASTKMQDIAKQFLLTLLSDDVQSQQLNDGYPVNESAYDAFCTNPYPEGCSGLGGTNSEGKDVTLDILWPTDTQNADFKTLIQSLDTPCLMDNTIKNTIIKSGTDVLNGNKSIEDSVNEIMQKMGLYFEE